VTPSMLLFLSAALLLDRRLPPPPDRAPDGAPHTHTQSLNPASSHCPPVPLLFLAPFFAPAFFSSPPSFGVRWVLLALERRRWACKAALPLAVLLARATRPSGWGVLGGVLRVCGVSAYVGVF
jgi:hypothetical protein